METWFANHVLGLCLSVLLLALPGPLRAGTPSSNSTDSATTGFYSSAATDELSDMETNATSASYSSESLSPSQRNILLTHTAETHTAAAENFDSESPQTVTETSSGSLDATSLSTEPLASTLVVATTEASSSSSSSGSSSSSISSSSISSSSISSSSISSSSIGSSSSISSSSSSSSSSISSSSGSISSSSISSSSSSISSISSSSSSSSISSSSIGSVGSSSSSSSDWKDYLNTEQVSDTSHVVSPESSSWMLTEEARMPQDSPDTTLRQGDDSPSMSHTAVHTDSTYTSTTISRTLLSVTSSSSNSTSSTAFTEDSNSQKPPSTWAIPALATETEDYTHSAPSARTDRRDTTDQDMTHSFRGMFSETGTPGGSESTQSYNEQRDATRHQHSSTSEETSDSTPTLRVTEPSTDHQSEVSVSSTPPITSPPEGPANISGTDQDFASSVGTSTESSTGVQIFSTQNQESTDVVSSQASEPSLGQTLTTGPPTASSTSALDHSLTDASVLVTEVFLSTTSVTVTERPHLTEENMSHASTSTSTTSTTTTTSTTPRSLLPSTSSSRFRGISSSTMPSSSTEATILYTPPSTTASTQALQTTAAHPTHRMPSSQTQRPSTRVVIPTKVTTLQTETSTVGLTTAQSEHIATTDARNTPTRSTESVQTTQKYSDRGTTEMVVTTSPTDTRSTKALLPRNPCASNPCLNGGMCVSDEGHQFTCNCQDAWTGQTCSHDVDECENDPCPSGSRCVNTRGSFSCECPLGFDLADGRTCTRAKTFLGTFSINRLPHDPVHYKSTTVHEIQREIVQLLNASLSALQGYSRSLLSKREEDGLRISAVNMFFLSADVTSAEVYNSIQMFLNNCSSSLAHCRVVLHHQLTYHAESLCSAQKTQCDAERSTCTDSSGTAQCQCHQGYYKHNPDDLSCLDCGDGYKLENGSCVPCTFGFGGFNCGNFYKLIAVVVSPAGGALLLIMIIALIVTCCKKDKNDINKIIFKSGDLQMSPYADFPKSNRISMEWGRETIEMQENGSTKNLLQMTDIYYSPVLRNSDLDRNGLYPFTGLPGSRHSCIYPAQWNPSFISDDSRRRDYF